LHGRYHPITQNLSSDAAIVAALAHVGPFSQVYRRRVGRSPWGPMLVRTRLLVAQVMLVMA
jgi:hypothetical protein